MMLYNFSLTDLSVSLFVNCFIFVVVTVNSSVKHSAVRIFKISDKIE